MKKLNLKKLGCLFLIIIMFLFTACGKNIISSQKDENNIGKTNEKLSNNNLLKSKDLKIHFIDVGQADSILITQGNHNMLIDAGNNDDANTVTGYLKKMGVKDLEYVIGTHPHEDHIGAMDNVINDFKIKKIYMPNKISNTKTYKDVIKAIKNKGLKITLPKANETLKFGDATLTIVAPKNNEQYDDVNNYSIVLKLNYKNTNFLFTGDAENISEKEILNGRYNIKSDLLKIGHHGSRSSTTEEFLNKVNPKYAVISCGKNNEYGHPHKATIDRLYKKGIPVYRTDESGTIIATSNGKNISFNVKTGSYSYNDNSKNKKSVAKTHTTNIKNNWITDSSKKVEYNKVNNNNSNNKESDNRKIKGNINSKGEKIYHVPCGKYYERTKAERWFSSEKEAQHEGFRRATR